MAQKNVLYNSISTFFTLSLTHTAHVHARCVRSVSEALWPAVPLYVPRENSAYFACAESTAKLSYSAYLVFPSKSAKSTRSRWRLSDCRYLNITVLQLLVNERRLQPWLPVYHNKVHGVNQTGQLPPFSLHLVNWRRPKFRMQCIKLHVVVTERVSAMEPSITALCAFNSCTVAAKTFGAKIRDRQQP